MSEFRTAFHDQVEYYLSSRLGRRKIIEPSGWDDDFFEIKRSKENSGVINKASTNLKFVGDGAEYLTEVKNTYGTEEEVILEKWANHPTKMERLKIYRAYVDLSEYKFKKDKVEAKAQESGLLAKIATHKSDKVELERLDSLNGNSLAPLNTHVVSDVSERVFKNSFLEVAEEDNSSEVFRMHFGYTGDMRTASYALPIKHGYVSDVNIYPQHKDKFSTTPDTGEIGMMFYQVNDRDRDIILDIKVYCEIEEVDIRNLSDEFFHVSLATFEGGTNLTLKGREHLYTDPKVEEMDGRVISFSVLKKKVTVLAGESLSLQFYGGGKFGNLLPDPFYNEGDLEININNMVASINVDEDDYFPASNNKILLPYERIERLLQIITGRTDDGLFYSEVFGRKDLGYAEDGELAYLGTSTGFWARKFDDEKFTTSWKDTMQTYWATRAISFGMEKKGDLETIVVEPLTHFYQTGQVFDFPLQVKNIERKIANEFQYSAIDVGYEKGGGEYEEIVGLQEPNGKHNYTTPFKRNERKHSLLSKDRGDMLGYGFARRKPKDSYPTEDTRYDTSNFLMDCKLEGGFIYQKKWDDIYITKPTGIHSPNTAANLDLTPKRNMQRHGWWLNGGLFTYKDQDIVFGSSEGNATLVTQKEGEIEIAEDGSLPISMLDAPKFKTEWITFQHKVDFDLAEMINGYTEVNGRLIPNIYFEWQFRNSEGKFEKCRIYEVKPKSSGKFKVIKV